MDRNFESAVEDSDFSLSENTIRLSALKLEDSEAKTSNMPSKTSEVVEEDKEDPYASSAGPKSATNFKELFGAAYDAHMASLGVSTEEEAQESRIRTEAMSYIRSIRRAKSLKVAELNFAQLFKIQTQVGGDDMDFHAIALEGWKEMVSAYILNGTEEQLIFFCDTYDAMYGLDARDRTLLMLKYHCKQSSISVFQEKFDELVKEGEADDRIFAFVAEALAQRHKVKEAMKTLDAAWMRALTDTNFKITHVFYRCAAKIYIHSLNLSMLSDLFIRLDANKPALDSGFFEAIFRNINHRIGINAKLNSRSSKDSKSSPTTQSPDTKDAINTKEENTKASDSAETKKEENQNILKQMFSIVEKSMNKHSIHPTTSLRNELIAFKLYTESDMKAMFSVLSTYSSKPDSTTTMNLMLDALLQEKNVALASTVCDAWDAQFGVKPNRSTHTLVSKYMELYSREALKKLAKNPPSDLQLATREARTTNGVTNLNSTYLGWKDATLELFDEFVSRKAHIVLNYTSLTSLMRLLSQLDKLESSKSVAGLEVFVAYLESYPFAESSEDMSLYDMVKQLLEDKHMELGKRLIQTGRKKLKLPFNRASMTTFLFQHYHKQMSFQELELAWQESVKQDNALQFSFPVRRYLQHLVQIKGKPSQEAHQAILKILARIAKGETVFDEEIFQLTIRLLTLLNRSRLLPNEKRLFELIQRRRDAGLVPTEASSSLLVALLRPRINYFLHPKLAASILSKLENFASDTSLGKFAEPLSNESAQEFDRLLDNIQVAFNRSRHRRQQQHIPSDQKIDGTSNKNPSVLPTKKLQQELITKSK